MMIPAGSGPAARAISDHHMAALTFRAPSWPQYLWFAVHVRPRRYLVTSNYGSIDLWHLCLICIPPLEDPLSLFRRGVGLAVRSPMGQSLLPVTRRALNVRRVGRHWGPHAMCRWQPRISRIRWPAPYI